MTRNRPVRFEQMAVLVKDRIENPSEAGVDRYVGLKHLDPDSLKIRRWGEPSDVESAHLLFRPGDIIFCKRRVYQRKLAVADFHGICSADAMVLRARPDVVLPEFLPFFMQSGGFMNRALEISAGSLSPRIKWRTLAEQEFALPPLDDQRRAVEALRSVEFFGSTLTRIHNFIDMLAKRWRIDYINKSDARVCCVADICVLRGGSGFKVKYQGQIEGELPFIKVSDMDLAGNEKYIKSSQNYISNQQALEIQARVLPSGSVVFAKVGKALFKNRKRILVDDTCIDNNMMAAIPNSEQILPEYLYLIFLGVDIGALAQDGAIPNVNQASLGKLEIRVPNLAQQRKLLSLWNKIESALNSSKREILQIKEIKGMLITEVLSHV